MLPPAPPLPMGLGIYQGQGMSIQQPPPSQPPPHPPFDTRGSAIKLDELGSNQQIQNVLGEGFTVNHL